MLSSLQQQVDALKTLASAPVPSAPASSAQNQANPSRKTHQRAVTTNNPNMTCFMIHWPNLNGRFEPICFFVEFDSGTCRRLQVQHPSSAAGSWRLKVGSWVGQIGWVDCWLLCISRTLNIPTWMVNFYGFHVGKYIH